MSESNVDYSYDCLIIVTPKDYLRLHRNYQRLIDYLPAKNIAFVGDSDLKKLIAADGLNAHYIDENSIIPFNEVYLYLTKLLSNLLNGEKLPRGICGWYYQQFLKMAYSRICEDSYYMVWDGDTIPCKTFTMFDKEGRAYLDLKNEHHETYFKTLSRILPGTGKIVEKSFISEHMLFNCNYMKEILDKIESNKALPGVSFWQKILNAIDTNDLQYNSFSEFETYGSYVYSHYPESHSLRTWNSFRYGGDYFNSEKINDTDYDWLSRDFYAISFEKGSYIREDHANLFDNPYYQEKLSARQMLELAQMDFEGDSYIESWD